MKTCAVRAGSIAALLTIALAAGSASARPLLVPDNGTGTADLPPVAGTYVTPGGDMAIIDGLPVGSTITSDSTLSGFFYNPPGVYSFNTGPHDVGGSLGGDKWASDGVLSMPLIGHGAMAGFNRNIPMPLSFEIHSAPTVHFNPLQSFATDFFRGFGQITADPDFALLRVVIGTDFGLPSPGHTTLTQQPGNQWEVDSFFDITYRIDFVGQPGSPLAGMSGSTTGTIRLQIGNIPSPASAAIFGVVGLMGMRRRRR